jgi:hypothetical protein
LVAAGVSYAICMTVEHTLGANNGSLRRVGGGGGGGAKWGVRKRDEGYRPLVLFQRQRMKQADTATGVFRAGFSENCSWTCRKEILKSDCNFRNVI